jgi:hypothetical protein
VHRPAFSASRGCQHSDSTVTKHAVRIYDNEDLWWLHRQTPNSKVQSKSLAHIIHTLDDVSAKRSGNRGSVIVAIVRNNQNSVAIQKL